MARSWRSEVLSIIVLFPLACRPGGKADLVFLHGTIYTVDEARPRVQALAVKGDRILVVGSDEAIARYQGPGTRVINLTGKTALPGLIDSHGHLLGLGLALVRVDLVGTRNYAEVIARVKARADQIPQGKWILGRGWDQNDWPEKEFPTHQALSQAVPEHPVYLTRVDGHAALANAKAMELAGITAQTPNPEGGKIHRHPPTGEPTGVFIDRAQGLITRVIPQPTLEEKRERLLAAIEECVAAGLTGVHDAGSDLETLEVFRSLARDGLLKLRVYAMVSGNQETLKAMTAHPPEIGLGHYSLTIRSFKLVADGALGSRGAALLRDYGDEPGNRGLLLLTEDEIADFTIRALEAGYQVNTHAIGDRGVQTVLNAYERALKTVPPGEYWLRVEHAQVIAPQDIPRFAQLQVIPSMQPTHATSDMYWAEDRLGPERIKGAYAWRALRTTGASLAFGSDFPVERVEPLYGFYAAVTRQDPQGWPEGGWFPEERVSREEALKAFTLWAARAALQEDLLGSLSPGKLADLVVLSRDIMTIPPEEILHARVEMTLVGGRVVYQVQENGALGR